MRIIDILLAHGTVQRQDLHNRPRFVLDNVAEYYYHHDKEFWRLKDFPYPMPPFEHVWLEYRVPRESYSREKGITRLDEVVPEARGLTIAIAGFLDKQTNWEFSGAQYLLRGDVLANTGTPYAFGFHYAPEDEFIQRVFMPRQDPKLDAVISKT